MRRSVVLSLALAIAPGVADSAAAQDVPVTPPQAAVVRLPVGVGFHVNWPGYGMSGMYDIAPSFTLHGIAGFFGTWSSFTGRVLYRLPSRPRRDLYLYGGAGVWRYGATGETDPSVGAGVGLEIDWRRIFKDSDLPLYSNIELGLATLNLGGYNGVFMSFGSGLHYRF